MSKENSPWKGVRERVLRLKPRAEIFGSASHQFRLLDRLSEKEVNDAEAQFGVRFPEEYRSFLLEVSAGGAGPFYGIFSLERQGEVWGFVGDGADMSKGLEQDWRFEKAWNLDGHPIWDEEPDEETFDDIELFDEAWDDYQERFRAIYWDNKWTQGAIVICHEGCALRDWLVVSGKERGNIWRDLSADELGLYPLPEENFNKDTSKRLGFADFYLNWLRECEATTET